MRLSTCSSIKWLSFQWLWPRISNGFTNVMMPQNVCIEIMRIKSDIQQSKRNVIKSNRNQNAPCCLVTDSTVISIWLESVPLWKRSVYRASKVISETSEAWKSEKGVRENRYKIYAHQYHKKGPFSGQYCTFGNVIWNGKCRSINYNRHSHFRISRHFYMYYYNQFTFPTTP